MPSRHLPPRPEPPRHRLLRGGIIAGSLLIAFTALCIAVPEFAFSTVAVAAVVLVLSLGDRRDARIAAHRAGDSICTFARGFGREIDSWIVRALYEELCSWGPIPPRATDGLAEVFGIVDEDLEDLIDDVATRAGYSWEHAATYRLYGRVRTIGDVAVLVNAQPFRRRGVSS